MLAIIDVRMRAELKTEPAVLCARARRDVPSERAGDLDGEGTDAARCAVNEDTLRSVRLADAAEIAERLKGRLSRKRNRRSLFEAEPRRHHRDLSGREADIFRISPSREIVDHAVDRVARAIDRASRSFDDLPGDVMPKRDRRPPCKKGKPTFSHHHILRVDPDGTNADEKLLWAPLGDRPLHDLELLDPPVARDLDPTHARSIVEAGEE